MPFYFAFRFAWSFSITCPLKKYQMIVKIWRGMPKRYSQFIDEPLAVRQIDTIIVQIKIDTKMQFISFLPQMLLNTMATMLETGRAYIKQSHFLSMLGANTKSATKTIVATSQTRPTDKIET